MPIILLIVVGAAAGFIATRLMKVNLDLPTTIVLGMAGAVLGGLTLRLLLATSWWFIGLAGAVVGAMALIWLWKTYGPK